MAEVEVHVLVMVEVKVEVHVLVEVEVKVEVHVLVMVEVNVEGRGNHVNAFVACCDARAGYDLQSK
jgi:hypothetical protein